MKKVTETGRKGWRDEERKKEKERERTLAVGAFCTRNHLSERQARATWPHEASSLVKLSTSTCKSTGPGGGEWKAFPSSSWQKSRQWNGRGEEYSGKFTGSAALEGNLDRLQEQSEQLSTCNSEKFVCITLCVCALFRWSFFALSYLLIDLLADGVVIHLCPSVRVSMSILCVHLVPAGSFRPSEKWSKESETTLSLSLAQSDTCDDFSSRFFCSLLLLTIASL